MNTLTEMYKAGDIDRKTFAAVLLALGDFERKAFMAGYEAASNDQALLTDEDWSDFDGETRDFLMGIIDDLEPAARAWLRYSTE